MEFLKTMEDGGYGMTISDSLTLEDILKDLDVDKLKFADQVFNQITTVSFGDISVSDFVIPGFTKNQTLNMNIPTVQIGDIVPTVNMNQDFTVSFSDYALDDAKLDIDNLNLNTGKSNLLADVSPFNTYLGNNPVALPFDLGQDSIDIGNLSVTINYSIDVPEGITNIHQIDLEGGVLEIELALGNVSESMSYANFTPNITINPTNLFAFSPILQQGMITFSNADSLHKYNDGGEYTVIKTYPIAAFHNLPPAGNGLINIDRKSVV